MPDLIDRPVEVVDAVGFEGRVALLQRKLEAEFARAVNQSGLPPDSMTSRVQIHCLISMASKIAASQDLDCCHFANYAHEVFKKVKE